MKPQRIQMSRSAGWRKPPDTVYVGRPTIWGNPWVVGGKAHGALGPQEAKARYEQALTRGELKDRGGNALIDRIRELEGQNLACWCAPGQACHADVLLHYANTEATVPPEI